MPTFNELLARKAALDKHIETMQTTARSGAIAQIKALMADHGLSAADLEEKASSKKTKSTPGKRSPVAAKYRNDATGQTWSGRGLKPRWMRAEIEAGKKAEDFAI